MDWILSFIAAGSVLFWILFIGFCILVGMLSSSEETFGAGVCFGLFLVLLNASGAVSFLSMSPVILFVLVVAYLIIGLSWSFCKWFMMLKERKSNGETKAPEAITHKWRIINWISFWPWSMVWSIINDPAKYLFNRFKTQYQRMSDSVFSDS